MQLTAVKLKCSVSNRCLSVTLNDLMWVSRNWWIICDIKFYVMSQRFYQVNKQKSYRSEKRVTSLSALRKTKTAKEELTVCAYCNGFYSSRYFYQHKAWCTSDECGPSAVSVLLSYAISMTSKMSFAGMYYLSFTWMQLANSARVMK